MPENDIPPVDNEELLALLRRISEQLGYLIRAVNGMRGWR